MSEATSSSNPEILSPVSSRAEHVVILGGGFGGWYAARHLAGILPMEHRITLVDRVDHMLYTPMLTEVAGGRLAPNSVAVPTAGMSRRVRFLQGEIRSVDVATKSVELASGEVLHATHLVLALGSTAAYHDIPGAKENSIPMKTLDQAKEIGNRIDSLVADAAGKAGKDGEDGRVSLVVAGGGYTGVESVAAIWVRMREQARLHGLPADRISATIVESLPRLMPEVPKPLAQYSHRELEANGIRVMVHMDVKSVEPGSVELSNGEHLPASLLVWDTGIEPSPLLKNIDVPKGKHHGVVVDPMFQVAGHPGVWAIGDCAEIPDPQGKTYPPTAQNASREGVQVARNIVAVIKRRPLHPFRYRMLGQLAVIAKRDAVAEILGVRLRGFLTWVLWWVIYIAKLPDNSRRWEVLRELVTSRRVQRTLATTN